MTASNCTDLVSLLGWRAETQPDRRAFTYVNGPDNTEVDRLSYGELDRMARAIGDVLLDRGAAGRPVLLLFPPGLELVAGFWGCLYAGAIAIPVAPLAAHGADSVLARIVSIAEDAQPVCVLTAASLDAQLQEAFSQAPLLRGLARITCDRDRLGGSAAARGDRPSINGDRIAYLQYTSGSTGTAKGVMVSHANILANQRLISTVSGYSSDSRLVNWAPPTHAAGLMYSICMPVCTGFPVVHMPTQSFLEEPARWLRAISQFQATHAGGANFGYELCVKHVTPQTWRELRLDCWQTAYSSGETVRPDTLAQFAAAAAVSGFRASAFQPSYGISEATLRVAQSPAGRFPTVRAFDTRELGRGRARELDPGAPDTSDVPATTVIGYGPPSQPNREIRIVDPEHLRACPDGEVGEVWVAGPDIAMGYWNRPEDSERTFRARLGGDPLTFLRTGDLGVIKNGELYLVGRLKELIIIRGANHFPQDIELNVEQAAGASGIARAAAFSCDIAGEEQLVIVAEVDRATLRDPDRVCAAIQDTVIRKHGLQIHDTVLVPGGALPRTGSGKLQRRRCRDLYLAGELEVVARVTRTAASPADPSRSAPSDLRSRFRQALAQRVGLPESKIEGDRPFAEYGLDSVGATKLVAELSEWLGRPLSPSVLFNYPTVDAIVGYLTEAEGTNGTGAAPATATRSSDGERKAIAIIGIGCRFPGGPGHPNYWRVLSQGLDVVGPVPGTRWDAAALYDPEPGVPGKTNSPAGGFIDGVDLFDRELFGMSERAAGDTDPQQRLLLELVWETVEDAGMAPASLAGSRTGVFLGISQSDYGRLTLARVHDSSPFVATGASPALAANRISYAFDLHGPSVSVDTACSSSLVAVHQACRAMENGDCDLAIAAGVSLVLTPDKTIALSQGTFLSSDGKCKPFDASANGYVRGEGAGVLLLKHLDRALADGDRIYAVIRGTAVNQDGKTNGLTAPNGLAQQDVIRTALQDAGLEPGDVDYLEAHGTGTALGDPIEVEAMGAVFTAAGPRSDTLKIGSVKSNIGHLEAAAGIAGLIKVALCLHHRTLVPTLHLQQLNPHIPFAALPITVQQRTEPWAAEYPRVAGVSAFGFGGTNAHAVLSEAPEAARGTVATQATNGSSTPHRPRHLLVLSGASEAALRDLAGRYATYLDEPSAAALPDICFTAATARSHLANRLAVQGSTSQDIRTALASFIEGSEPVGLVTGRLTPGFIPNIAFLFTGGGAQYIGMGQELYGTEPVFRAALDRCAAVLAGEFERPLLSVMFGDGNDGALLDHMAYMQPALFAIEYAISELWRSWGIEPRVVVGHSLGELAAACVAGVFSLEDGLRLIAARARLMAALPGGGEMLAVMSNQEHIEAVVRPHARELSIGAINGPENIVISGASARIAEVMAELEAQGIKCTRLQISGASHSPLVTPMLDEFEAIASRVTFHRPRIAVISNVTGTLVSGDEISTPSYWRRHVRETVRFAQGIETLRASGCNVILEVGPRPTLLGMARAIVGDAPGVWAGSLQKSRGDWEQLLETVSALHVHGVALDWAALDRDRGHRKVPLPMYAFQHRRYWVGDDAGSHATATGHPLLGGRIGVLGAFELDLRDVPRFIDQHYVFGKIVFPGAGFVELALGAAREHWGDAAFVIRDMSLMSALVIDDEPRRCLHVELTPESDDALQIRVLSGPRPATSGVAPIEHVRLEVQRSSGASAEAPVDLAQIRAACGAEIATATHYATLRALGLELGPAFQGLRRLWRGDYQALAEIELDPALANELGDYLIHPTMLDSGFQLSGAAQSSLHQLAVPVAFERISYFAPPGRHVWCHAVIRDQQGPNVKADIRFFDGDGRVLVDIAGYVKHTVHRDALLSSQAGWSQWVWRPEWQPAHDQQVTPAIAASPRHWLILADAELGEALARYIVESGERCTVVVEGARFAHLAEQRYAIASEQAEDFERLFALPEQPYTDVVHCWALDAGTDLEDRSWSEALRSSCGSTLHLTQAMLKHLDDGAPAPRLWLVTRGAQPVISGAVAFAQAPLWGFGRVLRREHPELPCKLIDVDPQAPIAEQADSLAVELAAMPPSEAQDGDNEPRGREVAVRARRRYLPQLSRLEAPKAAAEHGVRPDATYLVTGGLSGLGLLTARRLVERGARALALLGRRGRPPEAEPVLAWIEAQGVQLHVAAGDVSHAEDISRVLGAVRATMPPLRGVIHCAGSLSDRSLERQSWESFEEVCAPKIAGAWNLHAQTREDPLDFFVLFSSNSALVGLAGQSNYAAANAFLDALAHHRHAAGLPALSINWGPWAEVGMAARAGMATERLAIDPVKGIQVLDGLLDAPAAAPQAVVPATTAAAATSTRRASSRANSPAERAARGNGIADRLAQVPPAERPAAIRDFVRECVARVASKSVDDVPYDRPIIDLGLDSLMTVELRNKLSTAFGGRRLASTFIMNHPTVAAIAEYLGRDLLDGGAAAGPGAPAHAASGNGHATHGSAPYGSMATAGSTADVVTPGAASNVVMLTGTDPTKIPLTLIHGIGGYAWAYLPIRQYIRDRSIVLVNRVPTGQGLRDYVPLLVETIRTKQPRGPYILGGWSAGGRLAFEITAALERMGERVLGLFMFDVYRQTSFRRLMFATSRWMMGHHRTRLALADMHPIERLLTVFGTGIDVETVDDIVELTRLVLPGVRVPAETARAGLAEAARWFLDQLAANGGRGLMLPDSTGAATEALEMLLTIRHIYRTTMGEIRVPGKLAAPGYLINVLGNEYSLGWQRHFARPLRQFDVDMTPAKIPPRWGTPFSRFAQHIALFDPENVQRFGPELARLLEQIDGARPEGQPGAVVPRPDGPRNSPSPGSIYT